MKIKAITVVVSLFAFSMPAFAGGDSVNLDSNQNVGVSSGSYINNITNTKGTVVGGTIPSSNCGPALSVGAPGVGTVGFSFPLGTCNSRPEARDAGGYTLTYLSDPNPAERIAAAVSLEILSMGSPRVRKALRNQGISLKPVTSVSTRSTPASYAPAPKPLSWRSYENSLVAYEGAWEDLSTSQQKQVISCTARVQYPGQKKPGMATGCKEAYLGS